MPDGGRLTISTSNLMADADYCAPYPNARPGRYVLLSVADSGPGIDPVIRDHLFEPLFTTRAVGSRTGLELPAVYGIVGSHGGFLQFNTEPGRGTCFYLSFPVAEGEETREAIMGARTVRGGAETLLIVDDEEILVELLRRMVERQGYRALSALSAEEALRVYEEHKDEIDLVISDLIMPDMDGRALARELMRRDPDIRILISTGFSAANDITDLLEQGVKGVVMKPYQSQQLLSRIREALEP